MTTEVDGAQSQHVLCLVGAKLDFDRIAEILARIGGDSFTLDSEFSQHEPDSRMAEAFSASADRVVPSMTDADRAAIAGHGAVAYVITPPAPAADAMEVSARTLAVLAELLREGPATGVEAVKDDGSGIAHGRQRWLDLADAAEAAKRDDDGGELAGVLYSAFVRRPLSSGRVFYSCGMHLLGEADIELTAADDEGGLEWMDALARYLLSEQGSDGIRDGDTFGLVADGPRRVLRWYRCARYAEDDLFHNPHGYWRLTAA
jgi:hypothetical protein